jgi:hypothetical protein
MAQAIALSLMEANDNSDGGSAPTTVAEESSRGAREGARGESSGANSGDYRYGSSFGSAVDHTMDEDDMLARALAESMHDLPWVFVSSLSEWSDILFYYSKDNNVTFTKIISRSCTYFEGNKC